MAHIYRLIFALLLGLPLLASATIAPVPTYPPNKCNPTDAASSQPFKGDPLVTTTWACGVMGRPPSSCGWLSTSAQLGWVGSNAQYAVICTLPEPSYACPANSNQTGGSGASMTRGCSTNYEDKDGVCVRKPLVCEPGYVNDGADNCVLKKCDPGQIRVNGICVPDPDLCEDDEIKVDGKCVKKPKKCDPDKPISIVSSKSMPTAICEGGCVYMSSNAYTCADDQGKAVCSRTYYANGATCNGDMGGSSEGGPGGNGEGGGGDDNGGSGGGDGGGTGGTGGTGGGTGGGGGTKPDTKPTIPGTPPDPDTNKCPAGYYKSGANCYPNKTDTKPTDNGNSDGKCPTGYRKEGSLCIANQPPPDKDQDGDGKDDDDGDDKDSDPFCKKNPELDICKKGSFSGSCESGFTCEGDAVMCAVARDQHIRNCKLFDTPNEASKLFDTEKNKTGSQTGNLPGNESVNITGQLDTSNALGGGACVPDRTIEVAGASVILEFSRVCPYLEIFGNILVACAMVLAIRIVFRG